MNANKYTLFEYSIVLRLLSMGWEMKDFSKDNNRDSGSYIILNYTTRRNGRTDEEIERSAREARIIVGVSLMQMTGVPEIPAFRYKVLD